MNEAQMINLIRRVVREELAPIMLATLKTNTSVQRSDVQRTPSEGVIQNLRNVQPYGVSSRAPAGTTMMTTPVAGDPSHILMTGAFDPNKPDMSDGETILYNAFGQLIYLKNGSIHLGVKAAAHPVNLGDVIQSVLSQFLADYAAHTHIGNLGAPTGVPNNAAAAEALKSSPVDDGGINSQVVFTE